MKAKYARLLGVGDRVLVAFSNSLRIAVIRDIVWPRFLVTCKAKKDGSELQRWARYESIERKVEESD